MNDLYPSGTNELLSFSFVLVSFVTVAYYASLNKVDV